MILEAPLIATQLLLHAERRLLPRPTTERQPRLTPTEIWVVEGLDLSEVEPGDYDLICLPVKLVGGDVAPARVLLRAVQALPPRERA